MQCISMYYLGPLPSVSVIAITIPFAPPDHVTHSLTSSCPNMCRRQTQPSLQGYSIGYCLLQTCFSTFWLRIQKIVVLRIVPKFVQRRIGVRKVLACHTPILIRARPPFTLLLQARGFCPLFDGMLSCQT